MVSLICCYNNLQQYNDLKKSLENQTVGHELIGIDNRDGKYRSAAAALNEGAKRAKGVILIFLHQDIIFEKENSLENFINAIPGDTESIVGIFGAARGKRKKITDNLYKAETLDECCVAMCRTVWKKLKFNEELCTGWHLYVVELCMRASNLGIISAYGFFDIKHLSSGTVDDMYMKTFKELLVIYKDKKWITTTCKVMPTNLFLFYLYYGIWKIKKCLFGNLPIMYQLKRISQKIDNI